MLWFGWSLKLPLSCGAAPGISHFFLPGDSASNLTIESKGLTEAIQSQRTLPWTKGGGGINCRKLGKRICPSGNVSCESGVWTEASRKVHAATSSSSHLHGISGLVVQVSPGWNERKGKCKASERPSLPHLHSSTEMAQSTNEIQNSPFASVWESMSTFPTHISMSWQVKTMLFLL